MRDQPNKITAAQRSYNWFAMIACKKTVRDLISIVFRCIGGDDYSEINPK